MAITVQVQGTRRQQGGLVFVVCEYTHVESGIKRSETFGLPVGLDVDAAAADLIPVVEALFTVQEKRNTNRRVRDNGELRAAIAGTTILITDNQAFAYVLRRALAARIVEAAKYDAFLQEFTDAEIAAATAITSPQAATWKVNSAANAANVVSVKAYVPF